MKRLTLVAILGLTVGCTTQPPSAPTRVVRVEIPPTHNIKATDEHGTVWYVCATQPRTYLREVGSFEAVRSTERDHYIQRTECPRIPID